MKFTKIRGGATALAVAINLWTLAPAGAETPVDAVAREEFSSARTELAMSVAIVWLAALLLVRRNSRDRG